MKRRGVLGFLGGAVVAGPGMAKQAIASGVEGMSLGGPSSLLSGQLASAGYGMATNSAKGMSTGDYDPIAWAKRDLAEFLGRSASDLARERIETGVDRLDPDIAVMQSIALQAKIRMQRDRNFEKNRAYQRGWLERQIQSVLKNAAA